MEKLIVFALCAMAAAAALADSPDDVGREATHVDFTWGVEIPVRDGAVLNGKLWMID